MPVTPLAKKPVWYVYQFKVRGVPFYVGIGHHEFGSGRAEDRLRWVCSQIKRELKCQKPKWVLHTEVMKYFHLCPEPIECRYLRTNMLRAEALRLERRTIERLLATGHVLANIHHNRRPLPSWEEVVRFVKSTGHQQRRTRRPSACEYE